jgi:hypothetical protein
MEKFPTSTGLEKENYWHLQLTAGMVGRMLRSDQAIGTWPWHLSFYPEAGFFFHVEVTTVSLEPERM